MANEIEKLNSIAIADIEKVNGKTDANIEKFNAFEFTGYSYGGLTWNAGATDTHRGGHSATGNLESFLIVGGYH